jgi:hypothetical protein
MSKPTAKLPPLLRLPNELHLEIISYLDDETLDDDIFSLLRLRLTNRFYRALVPAPTHPRLERLEYTTFAEDKGVYACKSCVCLRHEYHFHQGISISQRAPDNHYYCDLVCSECEFLADKKLYEGLPQMDGIREDKILCKKCGEFKEGLEAYPQGRDNLDWFRFKEDRGCYGEWCVACTEERSVLEVAKRHERVQKE